MRRLLITGGAGYIGAELIDGLLTRGSQFSEIVIYDNLSRKNYQVFFQPASSATKVKFINGDILDSRKLQATLNGVDTVVHLAARVTTPYADQLANDFEQVNHWGSAELTYAVENSGVQHLIYLSSFSVYGRGEHTPLNETSQKDPQSFYGISKLRGEKHVERLKDKLSVHILRSANVYGFNRSMRMDSVINHFLFNAHHHRFLQVHGEGKQRRAFVHVKTLCQVLEAVLADRVPAGIYNVAERNLSVGEIADVLQELYPDLERVYQNRHIGLLSAQAELPCAIDAFCKPKIADFKQQLSEFAENFSF